LDDTLIVDEAVSREAFEAVARLARDRHGAEAEQFARDARNNQDLAGRALPGFAQSGISA
jgi:hypothetical protein